MYDNYVGTNGSCEVAIPTNDIFTIAKGSSDESTYKENFKIFMNDFVKTEMDKKRMDIIVSILIVYYYFYLYNMIPPKYLINKS